MVRRIIFVDGSPLTLTFRTYVYIGFENSRGLAIDLGCERLFYKHTYTMSHIFLKNILTRKKQPMSQLSDGSRSPTGPERVLQMTLLPKTLQKCLCCYHHNTVNDEIDLRRNTILRNGTEHFYESSSSHK